MMRRLGIFGVAVLVVLSILAPQVRAMAGVGALSGGASGQAPAFTLQGIQGRTLNLSDLRGRGAVLFFFTTWCPYCREKFPMLKEKDKVMASEGIKLVVIDIGETPEKVRSFAEKADVSFDIFLDKDTAVSSLYRVAGVPTFVLIDKEGRIVFQGNELPDSYKALLSS